MTYDIHALSGAYAVDAVDDAERVAFEHHLSQCATCTDEVRSLREAAALMSGLCATPAPAALRARVLADAAVSRPLPPVTVLADVRARSARRRVPAFLAAAAAFVVIGGAGATVWHPWERQSDVQSSESDQVFAAPDHEVVRDANGTGSTIVVSDSLNKAVVKTHLSPPKAGMVYELWLVDGSTYVRAGLVDQGGQRTVVLSGDPATATSAAITEEKAGGTDQPDLSKVVSTFDLSS